MSLLKTVVSDQGSTTGGFCRRWPGLPPSTRQRRLQPAATRCVTRATLVKCKLNANPMPLFRFPRATTSPGESSSLLSENAHEPSGPLGMPRKQNRSLVQGCTVCAGLVANPTDFHTDFGRMLPSIRANSHVAFLKICSQQGQSRCTTAQNAGVAVATPSVSEHS